MSDRSQCLASEAKGCDGLQVIKLLQLAGGEPLAHNRHVLSPDAVAVILQKSMQPRALCSVFCCAT
jgi:hypothetical protein